MKKGDVYEYPNGVRLYIVDISEGVVKYIKSFSKKREGIIEKRDITDIDLAKCKKIKNGLFDMCIKYAIILVVLSFIILAIKKVNWGFGIGTGMLLFGISEIVLTKSNKIDDNMVRSMIMHPLIIVGLIVMFCAHSYIPFNLDSKKNNERQAYICARDVIKKELKHYSNIKINNYSDTIIQYESKTGIYTIKGSVKYKNEFNADVKNEYVVQLRLTSNGYEKPSCLFY